MTKENQIEQGLLTKLSDLKYTYRADIRDRFSLEQNFREKFEALNRVRLSNAEFARLRDEIITQDINKSIKEATDKHNEFLKELGLPLI